MELFVICFCRLFISIYIMWVPNKMAKSIFIDISYIYLNCCKVKSECCLWPIMQWKHHCRSRFPRSSPIFIWRWWLSWRIFIRQVASGLILVWNLEPFTHLHKEIRKFDVWTLLHDSGSSLFQHIAVNSSICILMYLDWELLL